RFEQFAVVQAEGALLYKDQPEWLGLVEHPGVHGRDQGVAADKVHLQGENAKQQIPVRGRRRWHGGTSNENAAWHRQSTQAVTNPTRAPTVPGPAARRQANGYLTVSGQPRARPGPSTRTSKMPGPETSRSTTQGSAGAGGRRPAPRPRAGPDGP